MAHPTRPLLLALGVTLALSACNRKQPAPAATPPVATTDASGSAAQDAAAREAEARARAERERAERERAEREARLRALHERIGMPIYFQFDRSDLSAEARSRLDGKLDVLQGDPGIRIRIVGHTDERGSDEYNLALGQRRAAAAKRYLVQRGIAEGRIEIVSQGEESPVCQRSEESCWSQNRRDEFVILATGENVAAGRP